MEPTTAVAEPVETVTDLPDAPEPVSDDSGSLADHEASFGPASKREAADGDGDEAAEVRDRDDKGRFRHRSESHKAKADDVATINELTKELRAAEAELVKVKPDALSDSPRVRKLRREIAAIKAELGTPTPATAKPEAAQPRREPVAAPMQTQTQTRPKPTEDEIGSKYQTYAEFVEDLADWRFEQREAQRQAQAAGREAEQRQAERVASYQQRMASFEAKTPDFKRVTGEFMNAWMPPLLLTALVDDDKAPEYVYYLAQHPDVFDELVLQTDGLTPTEAHVARVQRRLKQHAQAATTGSAAVARQTYIPPRPPNPVRTGPIRTGEDLPGDESSLAEHERAFGQKAKRR